MFSEKIAFFPSRTGVHMLVKHTALSLSQEITRLPKLALDLGLELEMFLPSHLK